jgi:hypothetical protein
VDAASPGRVTVTFSAPMSAQALNPAAYTLSPALNVYAVTQGPGNSVILDVQPLTTGSSYTLSVAPVAGADDADLAGTTSFPISYNSGLALCLPFDTVSGGISPDTSGNGRNATLTGVTLGPGYSGSAAVLTGNAGSIATATLPALTQYTIAAWINMAGPGNSSFPRIVSMDNEGVEFYVAISGGLAQGLGFQASGVDVWRSAVNLLPAYGTWAHVAVTYSGTTSTPVFYLNGAVISTGAPGTATGTYGTAGLAGIGNRTSDDLRGFDGSIDQLEIFNRVLTPAEIAGLAAQPPTESFAQWMGGYGLSGSNPTVAYDKDGVPDLVKYVLALDPTFSEPSPLQLSVSSGNVALVFPVASDAQGVTLSVQSNTTLNPTTWTTLPSTSLTPWRVLGNATEYRALVPIGSTEEFFRLQVTSP